MMPIADYIACHECNSHTVKMTNRIFTKSMTMHQITLVPVVGYSSDGFTKHVTAAVSAMHQ